MILHPVCAGPWLPQDASLFVLHNTNTVSFPLSNSHFLRYKGINKLRDPTPTLLTIMWTQVPWFLPCLTSLGVSFSVVTTRIRITICFTHTTQCTRSLDPSVLPFGLSSHRHPSWSMCILFDSRVTSYTRKKPRLRGFFLGVPVPPSKLVKSSTTKIN